MESLSGRSFLGHGPLSSGNDRNGTSEGPSHLFKKPPHILFSMKGMMDRKTKSLYNIRTKKQAARVGNDALAQQPNRARSLQYPVEPPSFQKKGSTPGMDDYLTMAQLEDVWQNQGYTLGAPDVPQSATEYSFKYVEPVELGTFVKHQVVNDVPVVPVDDLEPKRSTESESERHELRSYATHSTTDLHNGLGSKAAGGDLDKRSSSHSPTIVAPKTNFLSPPSPKSSEKILRPHSLGLQSPKTDFLSPPSPPRVRARSASPTHGNNDNDTSDKSPPPSPSKWLTVGRPTRAASRQLPVESTQGATVHREMRPRSSDGRLGRLARNEVVSGVVHPALRPIPYFEPQQASAPSCRV